MSKKITKNFLEKNPSTGIRFPQGITHKSSVFKRMQDYKRKQELTFIGKNNMDLPSQHGIISTKIPDSAYNVEITDQKIKQYSKLEDELKRILDRKKSEMNIDDLFKLPENALISLPGNNNERISRGPQITMYDFRQDFTEDQRLNESIQQCQEDLQNIELYNDIDAFISHMRTRYEIYSKYLFMQWFSSNNLLGDKYKKYEKTEYMGETVWNYLNKVFYILFYIKIKNDLYAQYNYISHLTPQQINILKIYADPLTKNYIIINKYIKFSRLNEDICQLIDQRTYMEYFFGVEHLTKLQYEEFKLKNYPDIPIQEYIVQLLDIFRESPALTEPLIVYRCNLHQPIQDELQHDTFISTTLSKNYALNFCEYGTNESGFPTINGIISMYELLPGNIILYLESTLFPFSIDITQGENGFFHEMEILVNIQCSELTFLSSERWIEKTNRIPNYSGYARKNEIPVRSFIVNSHSVVAKGGKNHTKKRKMKKRKMKKRILKTK